MANQRDIGAFLPTTTVYDTASIGQLDPLSPEFKEFLVLNSQNFTNIAHILNVKDTGYYLPTEINTSQKWFQPTPAPADAALTRNSYRVVINFGALPNAATKSVAHNIEGFTPAVASWTKTLGMATNPAGLGIPLPYSSPVLNENITLNVDAINVNVTTAIDYSAFTITYIILELLKN